MMNCNAIEVLAPAGSPESLLAAVRAGADAVYLGGSAFSARANAKNFNDDQLKEAVSYCHVRGVKVYLAVNTVLLQEELKKALELVSYACTLPVDAVLVQDTGLLLLLQTCVPQLRLHASTQMSVHTPLGARALYNAGIRRVVLARELSLAEIAEIHAAVPVELETFVHGALCMSVSGQCYFSSVLGSRSGNRGLCAQPCRLPFSVEGGTGHDLSLKDLSMICRIGELADAGIVSAKIEGRMKRPEYVAAATRACRLAADGQPVPEELLKNLGAVFSRSGFTTGYIDAHRGRDMFGIRSREDVTGATNAVFSELRSLYKDEYQRIPVVFSLTVQQGEPVSLTASDRENHTVSVSLEETPQPAIHRAIDAERCAEQLKKTGGTPFYAERIDCTVGEGLSVPVSALNRLRREALAKLEQARAAREAVPFQMCEIPKPGTYSAGERKLRARFANAQLPALAKNCEIVYIPYDTDLKKIKECRENGFPIALEIPRGMFGMESALRARLAAAKEAGITDVWAGNLGAAELGKELGLTVHGGFSLNITNTAAIEWYRQYGLSDAELSFELTLGQAAEIGGELPRGLILYGRLPLMLTRNCPAANAGGCQSCKTAPFLTDRKGIRFPVQCGGACSEVLNSVPLDMADRLHEICNQDFGVLRFTMETKEEAEEIIGRYLTGEPTQGEYTRGLYYRGIE
ncbi:putative protease YdcP precursor [Caproiciproducens galactitolivorans]|uniref:Putative protease YdcP n=2 Tax=Caproiciproducens galactitolivorans TaxID=642589 RepID=A0A4Z0YDM6_9FIRM|nr:putative protease YdcP precursor [Caproiciproducens galactitolivorans]